MRKRLIVTGSTLRARRAEEKSLLREGVEAKFWPAIARGAIRLDGACEISPGRGGRRSPADEMTPIWARLC